VLIILVAGIFAFNGYVTRKKYEEQAVMAEKYLEAGNYEQAAEAYLKAISMKNSDKELLSIGLAEAYVGMNQYDKALEALRSRYQKTGGNKVKEEIEEVTVQKTDYEFKQSISHADIYFTNGEYEKAITEYENAKKIKSKEAISYERIAEAYIALGNYNQARDEITEGLSLTQSEKLNQTLTEVESYLMKTKYDEIISAASEYIYQENYEDAIKKLNEAITLLPKEENAYNRLAELYILIGKYDRAITILEGALKNIQSNTLEEILDRATTLRDERDERRRILEKLRTAVSDADTEKIQELLKNTFFTMKIAGSDPIYYSTSGEGPITNGNGLLIINAKTVYAGGFKEGMKSGVGVLFVIKEGKENSGWYCYKGEWGNDLPNGMGKLKEETLETDNQGVTRVWQVVTEGIYYNGTEDDNMTKYFYLDGAEDGSIRYKAKSGKPKPYLGEDGNPVESGNPDQYIIAEWYRQGEPTGEYYSVLNNTIWGVKLYLKK
jgi:tetratricopeptide (TPR) repeat protein